MLKILETSSQSAANNKTPEKENTQMSTEMTSHLDKPMNMAHQMRFSTNDSGEKQVQPAKEINKTAQTKKIPKTKETTVLSSEPQANERLNLINGNRNKVRMVMGAVSDNLTEDQWEEVDEIVLEYTNDRFEYCECILKCYPKDWRYLIIQAIIYTCETYSSWQTKQLWVNRPKKLERGNEFLFVESDEDVELDLPFHFATCSKYHTKCKWLGLFLSLLSEKDRFEETSGFRCIEADEDGPLRDDIFLHCMKFGADCQKMKFLRNGTPLGDSETQDEFGWKVDYVHLLCTQGTSLERIQKFMALGFDIHTFAKNATNGSVVELSSYIEEFWKRCVKKRTENGQEIHPVLKTYYEELPNMIRRISDKMIRLMARETATKFILRTGRRLDPDRHITFPHILRCNPVQNENTGGKGEHQVHTCLFYQQGCMTANGLQGKSDENVGKKDLDEFRDKIRKQEGRYVLCVYRVDIVVHEQDEEVGEVTLPRFYFLKSDENMEIEKMGVMPTGATCQNQMLRMVEIPELRDPGQRVYAFDERKTDEMLKPGTVHIVMKGHFDTPINFLVQLLFVNEKKQLANTS